MGNITGKELKAQGIDVCFAPVVDLCFEDGLPVKDNRYFGSDPEKAARLAQPLREGFRMQEFQPVQNISPDRGMLTLTVTLNSTLYLILLNAS